MSQNKEYEMNYANKNYEFLVNTGVYPLINKIQVWIFC